GRHHVRLPQSDGGAVVCLLDAGGRRDRKHHLLAPDPDPGNPGHVHARALRTSHRCGWVSPESHCAWQQRYPRPRSKQQRCPCAHQGHGVTQKPGGPFLQTILLPTDQEKRSASYRRPSHLLPHLDRLPVKLSIISISCSLGQTTAMERVET